MVPTLAVVEHLHTLKDLHPSLLARLEHVVQQQFALQGREKAFDDGVVETISFLAHAAQRALGL
nr:hypothetical protein [Deinococcus apachensis]